MIKTLQELEEADIGAGPHLKAFNYTSYVLGQVQDHRAEIKALKTWQGKVITFITQEYNRSNLLEKQVKELMDKVEKLESRTYYGN